MTDTNASSTSEQKNHDGFGHLIPVTVTLAGATAACFADDALSKRGFGHAVRAASFAGFIAGANFAEKEIKRALQSDSQPDR